MQFLVLTIFSAQPLVYLSFVK